MIKRTSAGQSTLDVLLKEARDQLATASAAYERLAERARTLSDIAMQEQVELQRHLEEFTIERVIFDKADKHREDDAGPLLDIAAMRSGAHDLYVELARTKAVHQNINAVLRLLQLGRQHVDGDQAYVSVQESSDPRLQQAMTEAREDERSRLAREIHDGPAQVLTNAIYGIQIAEQVARRSPDQVGAELLRLRDLLKDGVTEIRRFMSDLRPTMLADHGLSVTAHHYVEEYNRFFGKKFVINTPSEPLPLTPDQELAVFRIIQEAFQNIHKHAGSSAAASVDLELHEDRLLLTIQDDGHGFDPTTVGPRSTSGAGLPGMRERAKLAGADLRIDSAPGHGTTVVLQFPLRKTNATQTMDNSHKPGANQHREEFQ